MNALQESEKSDSRPQVTPFKDGMKVTTIYTCSAIGGFIAAIADVVQKEEASAVSKLTSMSARQLQVTMQPLWILLVLVALAAALCFVFQPTDRRHSFGIGMAIIAIIMTVTPYRQPPTGFPGAAINATPTTSVERGIIHLVDAPGPDANVSPPPAEQPAQGHNIFNVRAQNMSSQPSVIGVSVYSPDIGQEYYQKIIVRPGEAVSLPFALSLPPGNEFEYIVEVDGQTLPIQRAFAGIQGLGARVTVSPTSVHSDNFYDRSGITVARSNPPPGNGANGFGGGNIYNKVFKNQRW
ncbi:hypothetical protein [Neorhizobium galegae]|uniref:hypothetical protein n=1 Tax=Neorhizobium galegae TaxID=399 RepID=UPI0021057B1D|nr:hypothetical protein [Neorhizobium galegae]MCQ1855815.1 hypothetical protein [Neorhizobium galegae]